MWKIGEIFSLHFLTLPKSVSSLSSHLIIIFSLPKNPVRTLNSCSVTMLNTPKYHTISFLVSYLKIRYQTSVSSLSRLSSTKTFHLNFFRQEQNEHTGVYNLEDLCNYLNIATSMYVCNIQCIT